MSIQAAGAVPGWTLADRLRKAREHARLEQAELARALGASRTTIGNAERGQHKPRRTLVMAWAMATGVDVRWLETGEAPPSPDGDGGAGPSLSQRARPEGLEPPTFWLGADDGLGTAIPDLVRAA